ncbi:hypothetical protein HPY42_05920 [Coprothermobacteraceae bacterium]|nr:hypothetical protein [Coprothermobacteraceae bacterium]
MAILKDSDKKEIQKRLASMEKPVKMVLFAPASDIVVPGQRECMYCKETKELLSEVAELSSLLSLEVLDPQKSFAEAEKYGLKKDSAGYLHPALTFEVDEGGQWKHYSIWFYGIPAGYEFATLLDDLVMLSTGRHRLSAQVVEQLANISARVTMDVFVTPTCPYCPKAVFAAHQFAYVNSNFVGNMIEATEFDQLASKWNVYGVPKTVINEKVELEGAAPEHMVLDYVKNALL